MAKRAGVRSQDSGFKIETWDQGDFVLEQYADLAAARAQKKAALDAELAQVCLRHGKAIQDLDSQLSTVKCQLEAFTASRKAEFKASPDGDGRSYEHAGVTIGFRKLLDKVGLPRGDAKKQVSLEYLCQYRPEFVRSTPEFDLVALLPALKDGSPDVVKALAEHDITLKPGKDEFFLKVTSDK